MNRLQMAAFVASLFTALFLRSTLAAGSWGYEGPNGPSFWGNSYPLCNGNSQSPINIYEGDIAANGINSEFVYTNYDTPQGLTMTVRNNGHGGYCRVSLGYDFDVSFEACAVINLSGATVPKISGGGLSGSYRAAQFHLHWSGDENMGSEHKISSEGFPGELHIVHYKETYANLSEAAVKSDGLAVLGFMLEISASNNANYDSLVAAILRITNPGANNQVNLPSRSLKSFLPNTFEKFYRYSGSLTTPACYETVTWTVFKETIKISRDQLATFLELMDDEGQYVLNNARPVQPINGREVQTNYNPDIHWGYYPGHVDPVHWGSYYEACGKESQSPINIPSSAATLDNTLAPFQFTGFDSTQGVKMDISNNGHTITVAVSDTVPTVTGGSLPDTFNVAQFHFHWGANSMRGSEHTLDAMSYPLEVHIVTYKNSLGSLGNAVKKSEGLAVLGFFFEISDNDNAALDPIINMLSSVRNKGDNVAMTAITLDSFLPADRSKYYRYSGSLTTPGCFESVIWSVFDSKITVSEAQMNKFRDLISSEKDPQTNTLLPMVDNFRPVQFLNTRTIRRNFQVVPKPKTKWTYFGKTGSQNWTLLFPLCGSNKRQSPIDIKARDVEIMTIPQFEYTNFKTTKDVSLKMVNNGHSVTVSYESGGLEVSGGGLDGTYKVAQFHFHWGSVNTQGSEHTIDGNKYPMELHIVMYNKKYSSIGLAMTQGNGLAVLGFMLQVTDGDNKNMADLVSLLPSIKNPDAEVTLPAFKLDSILPKDKKEFFRYEGSLTTPTCDESVTWTVFYSTIGISEKQLNVFRGLDSSEKDDRGNIMRMVDNYRPVQPLGGRTVYANFYLSAAPSSHTNGPAIASIIFTILGKLFWNYS